MKLKWNSHFIYGGNNNFEAALLSRVRYSSTSTLLIYRMCSVIETAVSQERVDSRQKSFALGNYNECATT